MVLRVDTFKSGPFSFRSPTEDLEISYAILQANILFQTVRDLPILPNLASSLDEELIRRSIFGTAAIEGNPLGEEDVSKILANSADVVTTERAKKEILNLSKAYQILGDGNFEKTGITEKLVRTIHTALTNEIDYADNEPGKYRNHRVKVGNEEHGGVYAPPKNLDDIRNLMKEFVSWVNSPEIAELNPFVRASLAHYHFCLIHPFGDGNGRTARLLESIILQSAGIKFVPVMLSNFYYRNIDDYYWAFSNSIKNADTGAFVKFSLKGVIESLNEIKGKIIFIIRRLSLSNYYKFLRQRRDISQRQYDLLALLLESPVSFTHDDLHTKEPYKILYRGVSTRTASRDLKKLTLMKLLNVQDKIYLLNFEALG